MTYSNIPQFALWIKSLGMGAKFSKIDKQKYVEYLSQRFKCFRKLVRWISEDSEVVSKIKGNAKYVREWTFQFSKVVRFGRSMLEPLKAFTVRNSVEWIRYLEAFSNLVLAFDIRDILNGENVLRNLQEINLEQARQSLVDLIKLCTYICISAYLNEEIAYWSSLEAR